MKQFGRVFEYVWPQWPRLIVVVLGAILISFFFSISLMSAIPVLKVVMGEEGLHGWVDRKICNWRYGMDFGVPDSLDIAESGDVVYSLLVTDVDEGSLAEQAGLKYQDLIIAVAQPAGEKMSSARMLEKLATADEIDTIEVTVRRAGDTKQTLDLTVPPAPEYLHKLQSVLAFVPRDAGNTARQKAMVLIILFVAFATVGRCLARFFQEYFAEKVVHISIAQLRERVFTHVMHMPIGFFSGDKASDTTSRLMGDISATGNGIKVILGKATREPLKALGTLVAAFVLSWKLSLIFIALAPVTIGLLALLGKKIKKATRRSLQSTARMLGHVQTSISALRVVKVYNRQDYESEEYSKLNRNFLRYILRVVKIEASTSPIMDFLGMLALTAALLVGVHWMFSVDATIKGSGFLTLLGLLGMTAESIRKCSDIYNKVQRADAAAERVYQIVDYPLETEAPDAMDLAPLQNSIEFQEVVFTYPGSDRPVLNGVSLTVHAGQTVAVVGPNGSGKTTLVNLIPRFYEVDSGRILIDGNDIALATFRSLRDQISMVTQNVITFNDTIAANISYGKPDATRDEVIAAAKQSFAHEFIEPLPEGYDTRIGEHGSGFSGGQLQRIVIARAILKDPKILIFDEAMSQIDADSEAKIHQALSLLMKARTCFVIAHRFSTVISADSIAVLEAGRIIAQGTHSELVESCPTYQNLYETQLLGV